ncbi:acyl-CoA thioesterase [Actinoplanes sp. NPDC051343]|uniref:acyl-CoA thioesterase n=1 Tax=Actinoplanes sp. NPDC051343 TaxID=3363906 RepID=UPI00379EABFA
MSDDIIMGAGVVVPVDIYLDELDLFGMLHYTRYLGLVDRAWIRHFSERGYHFDTSGRSPDTFALPRQASITYERPIEGHGTVAVRFWAESVGRSSLVTGFRITPTHESWAYATGRRTSIKIDPGTRRPAPWTDGARADLESLLQP